MSVSQNLSQVFDPLTRLASLATLSHQGRG